MKLIIANWKNNPETEEEARALAQASDLEGLIICPPEKFLSAVAKVLQRATLGAQDVFWFDAPKPDQVRYVIVGHSDRRREGQTDEIVAEKMARAVKDGITPILCVGENWEQKQSGQKEAVIAREIKIALSLTPNPPTLNPIYIAYEPIWAISTAVEKHGPDKPEDTLTSIAFIKTQLLELNCQLPVKFLYGGSVNPANALEFFQHPEIAGALVGAASLKPEELKSIYSVAQEYR